MAAGEVVNPSRIDPLVVHAASIRGLSIKELHVEIEQHLARSKFLRQGIPEVLQSATGSLPQHFEIGLRVHLEPVLVHAAVQVNGKLGNPEKLIAAERLGLDAAVLLDSENTGIPEITIKPTGVKRAPVHFGVEFLDASGGLVRIGRHLQGGKVHMGECQLEARLRTQLFRHADCHQG